MVAKNGFRSRFVGRKSVLNDLKNRLNESINGQGQMVLISGEAGVGKTRLVQELKGYARSKKVRCLEGNCIYHEFSDPYLPFISALSDITKPSLVDDSGNFTTIEETFLINDAGIVVSHAAREGAEIIDEDIVGSMLSAVEAFVKDAFGDEESTPKGLDTLGYGTTRILIEHGKLIFLATVFSGGEPEGIREDLRKIVRKIEDEHWDTLKRWDGDLDKVKDIDKIIKKLIRTKFRIKRSIKNIDIKKEKDRVFERVLQLIVDLSSEEPVLLILEDIHWADISSLQLLQYLARNTKDVRVFICGTYRPEELDDIGDKKVHPLKEAIQRMGPYRIFTEIELDSLSADEVSEMLNSIFETRDLPKVFMDQLFQETEGNPFFIEEMLNAFKDHNIINQKDGRWQIEEVTKGNIPSSIKDLIMLRIERLEEGARNVITQASVLGHRFNFQELLHVIKMDQEELSIALEKLEDKKLIHADTDDDELLMFNHSKIQEVLYSNLGSHRRRLIHKKVAEVIEKLNKTNTERVLYQLAHHYSNTKNYDKALRYSFKAGEKASSEFALDEALTYYQIASNAIEYLDDEPENKRKKLEITNHLGDICYVIGKWESALEYHNIAKKLSEEIGDDKSKAESHRNLGLIFLNKNQWENALENLDAALTISEKIEDHHGIADTYYNLGTLYERKGEIKEAIDSYGKCMENAINFGDSQEMARGHLGIGRVYAQLGEYNDSIVSFKKAVEILENIGDIAELSKAYVNLGATCFYTNIDESMAFQEKAIELADKMGHIRVKGYALMNKAYIFIEKSELEKGLSCLDKALKIFTKIDERIAISSTYTNYGCIHRLKKDWDKAQNYFEKAMNMSEEFGTPYNLGNVFFEYGLMLKDKGDSNEADIKLNEALRIFKNLQNAEMVEKVKKELAGY